jgi:catechol 2,3-dioxygenase-like lactoylglutathione lyase family enzyme
MPEVTQSYRTGEPLIPVTMISHGTLSSVSLAATRRFFEQVLGFQIIQTSPISMIMRLGTDHTYVVVETGEPGHMQLLDHNGLDLPTSEAVDQAHEVLTKVKDDYGVRRINRVQDQHGAYSFYFQDLDANWWEIVQADRRGYSWIFGDGTRDITGRSDIDVDEMGHTLDEEYHQKLLSGK